MSYTPTLLDAAQSYLERGFSVFPCNMVTIDDVQRVREARGDKAAKEFIRNNAKKPKVQWRQYQERLATEEEIYRWFAKCDPERTAIAVVTGKISGIVVVDLDTEEAVHFADMFFPPAPIVKTGRGQHLYYSYQDGLRNFQSRADLPGIDFRGDGGYVIAPPSAHYNGGQYEWI